jgi:hypothetical protein
MNLQGMRWIPTIFAVFGFLLAVGFFLNGMSNSPDNAVPQQVQYLSWIISAAGWTILALSWVIALLYQILRELTQLNNSLKNPLPLTEGKPATENSVGGPIVDRSPTGQQSPD